MSGRIVVLSENIANKIAAGEVVERPASIVKELLENSIDAGADDIAVELAGGGQSIKIIDNGAGMEREDVPLAFARHATSKIYQFEDIYAVSSFGFRGEALPSIASVARVEILTRRRDDLAGTKAVVEGGRVREISPAGCPAGTQITVTDIFANVPARRKFLKTDVTEQSLCLDAITRLALAHTNIRFTAKVNGRVSFSFPAATCLAERINLVMGADFTANSFSFAAKEDKINLTGFISRPEYTKSNARSIFLFVNRRFIRDAMLNHAVMSACRQLIEARRYPACVLFIDLAPEDVDVNVHPAKMEVRFKDSRLIYELVAKTIAQHLIRPPADKSSFAYRLLPRERTADSFFQRSPGSMPPPAAGLFSRRNSDEAISHECLSRLVGEQKPVYQTGAGEALEETVSFADAVYLGQLAASYLIFAGPSGLILIDQHAAHERIIFERMKKSAGQQKVSQRLLLPEVVSLTPTQISLFPPHLEFFRAIGLEMEVFGRDAIVVKALPALLPNVPAREIICDLADELAEQSQTPGLQERKEKILAALACHAAIKANSVISCREAEALCRDLEQTPANLTCPHGRPIVIRFSLREIARMFKRK